MSRPPEHQPETILAAALAVFCDRGVQASTANVASVAGVSNGTLFNYFPTKQILIDRLYLWIKADLAEAIGEVDEALPTQQQMRDVWDRWLEWARHHRDAHAVMNLLYQSHLVSDTARAEGLDQIRVPIRVLAGAYRAGVLVDLPLSYFASLVQQQLDLAVAANLKDQEAATAFGVLWTGITDAPPEPNSTTPSTPEDQE